jgi:aminoglycoside phosphotransferase (APT) family kinase protein
MLGSTDLGDEFRILKSIEAYEIAPKVFAFDDDGFSTSVLIEEYIDGVPFSNLTEANDAQFDAAIDLFASVSDIKITSADFPSVCILTSYAPSMQNWKARLEEIANSSEEGRGVAKELGVIASRAGAVLDTHESLLRRAPAEFIYNDVHKGNLFWLPQSGKAKFIDWQKVSFGDPSFMAALFVRRFSDLWHMEADSFKRRVVQAYEQNKHVADFEELLSLRMLERAVAEMIWVNWAHVRKGEPIIALEKNAYYAEAIQLLSEVYKETL